MRQRLDQGTIAGITAGQRQYLASFDAWLRNPNADNAAQRQRNLMSICDAAGIVPSQAGETMEHAATQTVKPTGPRATHTVINDALTELKHRETRLKQLANELAEVREAIKALEKLLPKLHAPATRTAPTQLQSVQQAAAPQSTDPDTLVLGIITDRQPISSGALMAASGLNLTTVRASLQRLRTADTITMVGEKATAKYWLTADAPDSSEIAETMQAA